jgi:ribokinase
MPQPLILSMGSVNVDFQVRTERWPGPGETLLGRDFLMIAGGKAANVAYLARRLGCGARLLARVGDDLLADQALRPLEASGVDLQNVRRVPGHATGVALIDVRTDGEKAIVLAANANEAWNAEDEEQIDAAIRSAPHGSVLAIDLEIPVRVVWRAIEAARRCGHTIVLDPSPADRLDDSMCRTIDFVTPNTTETELLTGMPVRSLADGFRAGERLLARGVGAALVKLGAEGCAFVSGGARFHVRAEPRNVVDTTGAGDAFTGGLAVALLERRSTEDAVRFAVAASALAVLRYGSQSSYPCRDELERELPRIVTSSATL